jgi:hypothetical protein
MKFDIVLKEHGMNDKTGLFVDIMKKLQDRKTKRRLKAAFRRKPKPAKVVLPDEDVPYDIKAEKLKNE